MYEKLAAVQNELKAPKGQFNSFGKYKYRSCEDILEAVKPILIKHNSAVVLSDSVEMVADRIYIKATAKFIDNETKETTEVTAYAREPEDKKGMDSSQITGATSSYARKYALNGLFLIDDTKDADTDEHYQQTQQDNRKGGSRGQSWKSDEPEPKPNVDSDLLPQGRTKMDKAMIDRVRAEMNRTGITEKSICEIMKVPSVEKMSEAQYIACINKFLKTPDKT